MKVFIVTKVESADDYFFNTHRPHVFLSSKEAFDWIKKDLHFESSYLLKPLNLFQRFADTFVYCYNENPSDGKIEYRIWSETL